MPRMPRRPRVPKALPSTVRWMQPTPATLLALAECQVEYDAMLARESARTPRGRPKKGLGKPLTVSPRHA